MDVPDLTWSGFLLVGLMLCESDLIRESHQELRLGLGFVPEVDFW